MLKHFAKQRLLIFCISIFACQLINAQVVFSDFNNVSDYKGNWRLERTIPSFLADYFRQKMNITSYSPGTFISTLSENEDTTQIFNDLEKLSPFIKKLNATHFVTGTIDYFDVSRYNFSEPTVAGYEHYSSGIKVSLKIYNFETGVTEFSETVEGKIDKGTLGINLFGKPTDEKSVFYRLDNLEFGGEEFNKTIVGAAMIDLCENFIKEYRYKNPQSYRLLRSSGTKEKIETSQTLLSKPSIISGEVILSDELTGEIFINIGSSGVKVKDQLSVYQRDFKLIDPSTGEELGKTDKKIGEIEVTEIRGQKLSLCRILRSEIKIVKGMAVKKSASIE